MMLKTSKLLLLGLSTSVFLGCGPEHGPPLASNWVAPSIPQTDSAKVVGEFIEVINSGDQIAIAEFTRNNVTKVGMNGSSLEDRIQNQLHFYNTCRGLDVHQIEQVSDSQVMVVARYRLTEQWRQLDFFFGEVDKIAAIRNIPAEAPISTATAMATNSLEGSLKSYVDKLAAADQFSGVVLVAQNDDTKLLECWGMADQTTESSITADTCFQYASLGKMFTAVAIAQLIDANKLALTHTLETALPEFKHADAGKITISHLLTHHSGVPDFFEHAAKFADIDPTLDQHEAYLPILSKMPLDFAPGQRFQYSNSNFILLGAIIARASNTEFETYLREQIFAPCGMTSSGLDSSQMPASQLAVGYTELTPEGKMTPGSRRPATFMKHGKGTAAGGGFTNAHDLLSFANAIRHHKLCSPDTLDSFMSAHVNGQRPDEKYGYGFIVREYDFDTVVGHSGGFPGVDTQFDLYRDSGWTVIVLSNYEGVGEPVARHAQQLIQQQTNRNSSH